MDSDGSSHSRRKKDKKTKKSKKSKKSKQESSGKRRRHDSSDENDVSGPSIKRSEGERVNRTHEDISKGVHTIDTGVYNVTQTVEASKPPSKADFFKQLLHQEGLKGQVGTSHASGKEATELTSGGNDWECPKCSASNFKNSNQCQKCHALKRMSQYR